MQHVPRSFNRDFFRLRRNDFESGAMSFYDTQVISARLTIDSIHVFAMAFGARVVKHAIKPLTDHAYGYFAAGKLIVRGGRSRKISHQAITRASGRQHYCDMFGDVFRNVQK
jgi:hypothetical protein